MNDLFHFNYIFDFFPLKKIYIYITFLAFVLGICTFSLDVYAMKPLSYSYKDLYDEMPSSLKSKTYIYNSNNVGILVLAKNKDSSDDYRTSVKHSGNDLYYCIDYSSHFTDDKTFSSNTTIFDDELRARIALAIQLGTSQWNTKADSAYTTGNFLEDYYMTQMVIHGLIYKYGGKLKDHGVKFDDFDFKSGTGNLEKKTKALYTDCCNAIYHDTTGSFQAAGFSFVKSGEHSLLLNNDESAVVSDLIDCQVDANNGQVAEFKRTSNLVNSSNSEVLTDINVQTSNDYNSSFIFSIPKNILDTYSPGLYTANIGQTTAFSRVIAKEWFCSVKGFLDNQAVAGYSTTQTSVSDSYSLNLLIGAVELVKKDSLTKEYIEDAEFQLFQFDNTIDDYTFYKNLTYSPGDKKYYSGNIYASAKNPTGRFKVIESNPGKSHINDWTGQEFTISADTPVINIEAENSPILGKLHIHKDGDIVVYDKDKGEFKKADGKIDVPNVKFQVYAKEDIMLLDQVKYKKDQKIFDIVTDNKGEAWVNNIIPGKYYIKESETNPIYILDPEDKEFDIIEEDGVYKDISYTFNNELKKCNISIYKYTKDFNNKNIPLSDCKFALFAQNDITDPLGKVLIAKDTKIKEVVTNSDGIASFSNLLYADYYIKEIEVPKGIIIIDEILPVTKDKLELKSELNKEYEAKLSIYNKKQKYRVNLNKSGEQFVSAIQKECDNGTYFEYQTDFMPLKDVTYSLYDSDNQKIMTEKSDANGIIRFEPLEYGNYYCVEESAPANYVIDKTPINISCTRLKTDEKTNDEIIEIGQSVKDNMCDFLMEILKLGEVTYAENKSLKNKFIPLSGVVYGVYQDFDYTFPSGDIIPANTCVGYITTDSFGKGTFNNKLPEGNYHLQELKALNGYDIDTSVHSFEVKADNNNTIKIDLTNEPFNNYLSKSGVKIIKIDSNSGKRLKGVEFTLYDSNKKKIGVYKTDKHGEILVNNLPYGTYYFIETKARRGYYSSNNSYNFKLDSNEYKQLEITNTPILKLGFNEHYKIYFAIICLIIICGAISIYIYEVKKKQL